VALLDDLRACADLPVVKPKDEKTDGRCQKSEDRSQIADGRGQMFPIADFGFQIGKQTEGWKEGEKKKLRR